MFEKEALIMRAIMTREEAEEYITAAVEKQGI